MYSLFIYMPGQEALSKQFDKASIVCMSHSTYSLYFNNTTVLPGTLSKDFSLIHNA